MSRVNKTKQFEQVLVKFIQIEVATQTEQVRQPDTLLHKEQSFSESPEQMFKKFPENLNETCPRQKQLTQKLM